ncbi:MAG: 30S ribosomal protein S16 [Puniceicoccaceae bacterium]|nr:MAG: 30S ribosomal protein S16 [Puniceicoccaceae bacterium]
MALRIKLARGGAAHNPVYRIVVAEARSRRDGRFVEILGTYAPRQKQSIVRLDLERADYWVRNGAVPTDTVRSLLKKGRKLADAGELPAAAPAAAESEA